MIHDLLMGLVLMCLGVVLGVIWANDIRRFFGLPAPEGDRG